MKMLAELMIGLRRRRGFMAAGILLFVTALPVSADIFMWEVQGRSNKVYLLGSMHLLPNSAYPLPDAMEQAYRQSEIIVFETDIGTVGDEETQMSLLNAGMYPEGQSLMNVLDTRILEPYAKAVQRLQLPVARLNRYRPWLAALTIEMSVYANHNFKSELGVDRHFYEKAVPAEKQIITLETIKEQAEFFTTMDSRMAQDYLALTLENLDDLDNDPRELYEIWADGDDGEMEDIMELAEDDYPAIYNRFIRQRNRKWLPTVLDLLTSDKNALVIVGAMHLPGDDGLLELLENAGYDPRQL